MIVAIVLVIILVILTIVIAYELAAPPPGTSRLGCRISHEDRPRPPD